VLTVAGDIADPAAAGRITGAALDRFGRIDTLVNNAGVYMSKPFTGYTAADYATIVGVNLTGFFWLTQQAIAEMAARYGGHVVNVTGHPRRGRELRHARGADRADQGRPGRGHPVTGRRVRRLRHPGQRRLTGHHPDPVHPADSYDGLGGRLPPLGRVGQVSDVVEGILFLESSPYITSEILDIDGGQIAGH
jgi:NAD(P)-dependent dehydrogenase (short-subunit alcohol dehydrogenase family)